MSGTFTVEVNWTSGLEGDVTGSGLPGPIAWGVPPEFGGPEGRWTPEHLLASSVASCIMATFLTVAKMTKLEVRGYHSTASCSMEPAGGGALSLAGVEVRPTVGVAAGDEDRAKRTLEKAKSVCPISKALGDKVEMHASVETV